MPTTSVILVPGAWHNPICYSIVAHKLKEAGDRTVFVSLASVGPEQHLKDFDPDVTLIQNAIEHEADAGHEIMLVVRSYSGVPGTEAVKGLDIASRANGGLTGGVAHIFYCCSFIVQQGQSLASSFGGHDLPWYSVAEDKSYYTPRTPIHTFYNDLPIDEAKAVAAHLKPHSYQVIHSKITYAAWKGVPSTYLYCTEDNAIPLEVQKLMVEEFAKGYKIRTETLVSGHSPFFSQPDAMAMAMAMAIRRAAGETV
ncbi:hypothetical protein M409DRAFT_69081 [Zasmidium cellare ATCC 36951]|uniref:AB hydrolase-1 domain-containing protein n=1 Tax=Zasmidium cellare ATCC 36951 TaxID=1080233 RepID=A0A6A6CAK4_ZASCE|nr:uncharacterized protein M409DRAFT_69081 [Zasmidium cellare ATCC 36951]KAF2162486.1 hypothetical protein M409DRAFT_69081 [Zasmidium cellare ATCC 36951]